MKTIMWESMPRWYGLSWNSKNTTIHVRLNRGLSLPENLWSPANGARISAKLGFRNFESDLDGKWFGFDRTLEIVQHSSGEYREFIGKLPRVRIQTRLKCFLCEGKGKRDDGEKCFSCDGTGRDYGLKWKRAEALAISIGILLYPYEYNEQKMRSSDHQLLTVNLNRIESGASITGMISIPLHHWTLGYPRHTRFTDIEEAMLVAYRRMMGNRRGSGFRVGAYSSQNHLTFNLTDCGIWGGPDYASDVNNKNLGYRFYSKDLYTSVTQLTLLAGLAALHDRADREIKEQQKTA